MGLDKVTLGFPRESSAAVEGWLLQSCRLVCGRISTLLVKVGDRGSSWDEVVHSWLFTVGHRNFFESFTYVDPGPFLS